MVAKVRYVGTSKLRLEKTYRYLELAANDEEIARCEIDAISKHIYLRCNPYGLTLTEDDGDFVFFEAREISVFATVAITLWQQTDYALYAEVLDAFLASIGICWCED